MKETNAVTGLKIKETLSEEPCSICPSAKMTKASHPSRDNSSIVEVGDLLEIDLMGKITQPTISGEHYALVIRDRVSKFCIVKLLRSKEETADELQKILVKFEVLSGKRTKRILMDNGSEFKNSKVIRL